MRQAVVAALLGLLAVAAYSSLQNRLNEGGLLSDDDVLFDADPGRALRIMVHGQGWEGRSLQHPLWATVTHLPLAAGEAASRPFRTTSSRDEFLAYSALLVSVLAGAVSTVLVFLMLVTLRMPIADSVLAAIVYTAAFSQLVFSSMPEHWILSGVLLSATVLIAARHVVAGRVPSFMCHVVIALVAGAITVTNAALALVPLLIASRASGAYRGGLSRGRVRVPGGWQPCSW